MTFQRPIRRPASVMLLLLSLFLTGSTSSVTLVDAFAPPLRNRAIHRSIPSTQLLLNSPRTTQWQRIASTSTVALPLFMMAEPLATALGAQVPPLAALLSLAPALDPAVESEVLNDMAHVALDLTTFFGPTKILLRCSLVLGRLLAVGADYIPDHYVQPEELVFQAFMLTVAWCGLVKSALPMALASLASNIRPRDGKTFHCLFEPAGLTWSQYKAMSVVALDWVEVAANEVVTTEDDDYIYWLYSGDANVYAKGLQLYHVERCSSRASQDVGLGLFGESKLHASKYPPTTVHAGPRGATLLRMNRPALTGLMEADADIAQSMRNLVFQGMQDKLVAQYETL